MPNYYSSREAAEHLGVSRQTLYSYVSRGILRAHAGDTPRQRSYLVDEVVQLARKRARARKPRQIAQDTLNWGLPVIESTICLIAAGRLFYRGKDVLSLAETHSVEDVAALLWECPVGSHNFLSHVEIVRTIATSFLHVSLAMKPLHEECARAWSLSPQESQLLRKALILCADHELNASSFTVRCIAATGATLHAAILGGVAALSGPRHGGATNQVEALWDEIARLGRHESTLRKRLDRGDVLPGFGHPLYPDGDVRAAALLSHISGKSARWQPIAESVEHLTGLKPTVDFALVALRRYLRLPAGAAFGLFALGRSIGWVAHALEQSQRGELIRPRAAYVGPAPEGLGGRRA